MIITITYTAKLFSNYLYFDFEEYKEMGNKCRTKRKSLIIYKEMLTELGNKVTHAQWAMLTLI